MEASIIYWGYIEILITRKEHGNGYLGFGA